MADKKISDLTGATTPLAGTEVLPIVQSSSTKKVSVANLTAGRAVAGLSFVADARTTFFGGGFYDANFVGNNAGIFIGGGPTVIPSNGAGSASNGTLSLGRSDYRFKDIYISGNVVVEPGKGIDFSANTAAPGMTSELLTWYEEGAWTPVATSASGTITTYTSNGRYTRIGNTVYVIGLVATSDIGTASGKLNVAGLPFTSATNYISSGLGIEVINTGTSYFSSLGANATTLTLQTFTNGGISWANNSQYHFTLTYRV